MDWNEAAKNIKGRFIKVDSCLIWTGATVHGYGCVSIHNKRYRVHRIVWQLFNQEIPNSCTNVDVLHKCNNKLCSNPDHLYLGTAQENLYDAYRDMCFSDGRKSFKSHEKELIDNLLKEGTYSLRAISRVLKCDHHKVKRYIDLIKTNKRG